MDKEKYDLDVVSVVDEDGKEHVFEEVDRIETDGGKYIALLPLPENPENRSEEDDELIILKVEEEDGDCFLVPVEDDDEFNEVGSAFEERLAELFDFEDETE